MSTIIHVVVRQYKLAASSEAERTSGFLEHSTLVGILSVVLHVRTLLRLSNGASLLLIVGDFPGVFATR